MKKDLVFKVEFYGFDYKVHLRFDKYEMRSIDTYVHKKSAIRAAKRLVKKYNGIYES